MKKDSFFFHPLIVTFGGGTNVVGHKTGKCEICLTSGKQAGCNWFSYTRFICMEDTRRLSTCLSPG